MFSDTLMFWPTRHQRLRRPAIGVMSALLGLVTNAFATEVWDKPPQQWTLSEVFQILRDSPWSPSGSNLRTSMERVDRRIDPLTGMPSTLPADRRDTGWAGRAGIGGGNALPEVSVVWWSSKTFRLAQQRLRQFRNPAAAGEPLHAESMEDIVIVVEGSEPLRILRDAQKDLRESTFLELPGGRMLDVRDVQFFEGERAGEDYVAFHFPRELNDRPTIERNAEKLVFHCKAVAKNAKPGRQNVLSIRATFEPRKMRVNGRPDL